MNDPPGIQNTMQIKQLLSRYLECMKGSFGKRLLSVAVFGSVARGRARFPGSDIDVLIVMEGVENLSFGQRIKLTIDIEEKLSQTKEFARFKDAFGMRPNFQEILFSPDELKAHPPILLDLTTDSITRRQTW